MISASFSAFVARVIALISHPGGRKAKLFKATLSSIVARGISILVMFMLVPLAHANLTPEGFGVWMTLSSLLVIVQFADFGIGNGLVTVISTHYGQGDHESIQAAVSSGAIILGVVAIGLLMLLFPLFLFIDWQLVFKVTGLDNKTLDSAVLLFSLCLIASIPAVIGQKILWGFQEMPIANIWQIVGNIFTLLLMGVAVVYEFGLSAIVAAVAGGPLIALTASTCDQFIRRRPWLSPRVRYASSRMGVRLLTLGGSWSVYQVGFFLATAADAVFVTGLFGAEAMGTYGLMLRLMSGLALALFFTVPLWPLFADGLARGDHEWVKRTFHRVMVSCVVIGVVTALILIVGAQPLARVWVGASVVPDSNLVYAFAAWSLTYNIWSGISSLMANEIMMKKMVAVISVGSLFALALKIPLAKLWGPAGVCWASVIGVGIASIVGGVVIATEVRNRCASTKSTGTN